ncbi:metal ABC transporter solute-binding protein, Zn/Mn family [Enterococcus casseliflavus]|uniref:metal ABC transporter solute-binding protein, Zn/Mn family n=1 Tax=Enterococcus casseliflavus TaxID=37734 RepID=UPI001E3882C3|nr:zinc ABC transporter substrate-binding protein [Enterococcus casseliflavus]
MKKIFLATLVTVSVLVLGACGKGTSSEKKANDKPTVTVTTSFLRDMVTQIAGDKVTIKEVIPAGEDPHLYVAKSGDLKKISSADLVLYHGLHFEGKMVEALEQSGVAVSKNFPKDQELTMDEDGESITDPHFWFDLNLYSKAVDTATDELAKLLKDDSIKEKGKTYQKELKELDSYIKEQVATLPKDGRYLITPHDAFNYFSRSYGIKVVAPQGVSTEGEVSNTNISETVDFIVDHKVKAIFAESTTDPARMEKLKENVEAKGGNVTVVSGEGNELFSDSLAPVGQEGDTFIDMYRHNIDLIVSNLK